MSDTKVLADMMIRQSLLMERDRLRAEVANERADRRRIVEADDFRIRDLEAERDRLRELLREVWKHSDPDEWQQHFVSKVDAALKEQP